MKRKRRVYWWITLTQWYNMTPWQRSFWRTKKKQDVDPMLDAALFYMKAHSHD